MSTAITPLAELGMKEQAAVRLHLGCGKNPLEGWTNIDQCALPGVDVVADLDNCANVPLPFADDTFEEMLGSHIFEHIKNPLPMMQELHRIMKPGGQLVFITPYGSSDDAWENPTHVRAVFLNTYGYFSQPFYWREDYSYKGDFLTERIVLKVRKEDYGSSPDAAQVFLDVQNKRNVVAEMVAFLKCVKPIRPAERELQVAARLEFLLI